MAVEDGSNGACCADTEGYSCTFNFVSLPKGSPGNIEFSVYRSFANVFIIQ